MRIYTSIITVQELAVATHRCGALPKDVYADVMRLARVYSITKEVAQTAAKREAEVRDLAEKKWEKRDRRIPETEDERLERICENRRRKWDCFHLATAQLLKCSELYTTDITLKNRPKLLGLKDIQAVGPDTPIRRIKGGLVENAGTIEVR